ncbi:hypothetical protein MNBD_NITROSPIRAE01-1563 [hydrothermal vent metagenome]|uniref:HicB-like antitoxin of toxin-antitoxin system domain-containing protein n=1 Tax=hydrothermal vent metagenome TaxID=652676 RepID=A0A3B1DD27_9ZZZZ
MKLRVVLESKDHGSFKAHVPSLRIYTRGGENEREALDNVRSAVLLHLGIEETIHSTNRNNLTYYQYRLKEAIMGKMTLEKKQATLTALTGICLMMAVIWGASFFA